MKKRMRMTRKHYDELVEARAWCARNGLEGFTRWYDDELTFHGRRRSLPLDVQPIEAEERE